MLETSIETTTMLLWSAKEAVHIQQDYDSAVHSTADQNQMRLLLGAGWRQQSNSFPPYAFFIRLWVGCIWRDATTTMLQHSIVTSISFTFFKSMEFWLIKTSLTTEMGGGCLMKRGPIVLKIPWLPIPLVWWVWIEPIGRYFLPKEWYGNFLWLISSHWNVFHQWSDFMSSNAQALHRKSPFFSLFLASVWRPRNTECVGKNCDG